MTEAQTFREWLLQQPAWYRTALNRGRVATRLAFAADPDETSNEAIIQHQKAAREIEAGNE